MHACKEAWKSLRDGLRYQLNNQKKPGKSGDSIKSDDEDDDDFNAEEVDSGKLMLWKFWDVLRFVVDTRPQRK